METKIHHCLHCQKQFKQKTPSQIYCSKNHQQAAGTRRYKKRHGKFGRWGKGGKPLTLRVCVCCNKEFNVQRVETKQVYCSIKCRANAAYIRNKSNPLHRIFGTMKITPELQELVLLNYQLKKLIREKNNVKHPGN